MRWLFLLLLVLNVFYYVWHQQEAPLRAKDVTPLSMQRGSQHDIRLLSEAGNSSRVESRSAQVGERCVLIGGVAGQDAVLSLERRLGELGVKFQPYQGELSDGGYWLQISPQSERLLGDAQLQNLSKEFNELKHKIMQCGGVAPIE